MPSYKNYVKILLTKRLVLSFDLIFILLVFYTLLRLGFYISNFIFFSGIECIDIFLSFMHGIRFDFSAIFISNSAVFLLLNFPFAPSYKKWYRNLIIVLFCTVNFIFFALNVSDFGYYSATHRRLLYEPYTMLPDIMRMIPSAISHHYILFIILISGSLIFIYVTLKVFLRFGCLAEKKLIPNLFSFILITLIAITSIRGGFQLKPLRQANAFYSDSRELGHLTLNSTYNVIVSSFQETMPDISFMPEAKADEIVRSIIKDDKEVLLDSSYVFLRRRVTDDTSPPQKLNVVMFIMENWSSRFCGSISGGKTLTPFFDSISVRGLLLTNFFANGQRSIDAVPSILASVPSLSVTSIISSVSEMNHYRGLGTILKENGYSTSFFHGAATGSMGFDGFSKIAGFTEYFGKEDFSYLPASAFDGSWGIFDEPFFLESENKISSFEQPFCTVIYSLSSHDPYKIPDERSFMFDNYSDEADFERSIRYSDFCLQKFFEKASQETWYNNTLFVITSDHTLFNIRVDFYLAFHSLLLLYTPSGILKPGVNDRIASHIDILPTIIDVLQIPAVHSSMGTSVFSNNTQRYCFEKFGNDYCIINDEFVLLNDLENPPRLYFYKTDPSLKNNVSQTNKEITADHNNKLLAYTESVMNALKQNRIFR